MNNDDILKTVVRAVDSKKGEDIQIIGISDLTVIADYFVIATGTSSVQVKALADEVEYRLSQQGVEAEHIEGRTQPWGWVCLDYNSVVVHIFYKGERDFYRLERLWEDGVHIDAEKYLND